MNGCAPERNQKASVRPSRNSANHRPIDFGRKSSPSATDSVPFSPITGRYRNLFLLPLTVDDCSPSRTANPCPDIESSALLTIHFYKSDVGSTRTRVDLTGERYPVACQLPLAARRCSEVQFLVGVRNVRRLTRWIVLDDFIGAAKGYFAGSDFSRSRQRHG